jgi:hypothetical protein
MPASRSQKLSVPNTNSKGSPAEKPSESIRNDAGSRYTRSVWPQVSFGFVVGWVAGLGKWGVEGADIRE